MALLFLKLFQDRLLLAVFIGQGFGGEGGVGAEGEGRLLLVKVGLDEAALRGDIAGEATEEVLPEEGGGAGGLRGGGGQGGGVVEIALMRGGAEAVGEDFARDGVRLGELKGGELQLSPV